ncbi:MAG: hypothetical protein KC933_32405 [Myxococcales bacterium]|nr:hypothetical protein [Myxococcales bacterium]MCB9647606.1 hypothetical protein [Deltaproteobacteria bacterium]
MGYIVGVVLMLLGLTLGLIGEQLQGPVLLIISGLFIAAGVTVVLLVGGGRGGRGDEPDGHIRP